MTTATKQPRRQRFSDLRPEQRQRLQVAVHEAAHSIAIVALGGQLHSAQVFDAARNGRNGETRPTAPMDPDAWRSVLLAGPLGEARFLAGGRAPSSRLLRAVMNGPGCEDDRALVAGGAPLPREAGPLVDRCWPAVIKLAQHLVRTGKATHADALRALRLPEDRPEATALGLAAIRSGAVPGSFTVHAF